MIVGDGDFSYFPSESFFRLLFNIPVVGESRVEAEVLLLLGESFDDSTLLGVPSLVGEELVLLIAAWRILWLLESGDEDNISCLCFLNCREDTGGL